MKNKKIFIVALNSNTPSWEVSEASLYIGLQRKQHPVDYLEQVPAKTRHHHSV